MAVTVGVSWSGVSRVAIEASEEELKRRCDGLLEKVHLLILYVDEVIFGDHPVLGIAEGTSENRTVARRLLEDVV